MNFLVPTLNFDPSILVPILFILGIGTIFFLTYYFSAKNVIKRTLARIPTKPLSSMRPNELFKVTGKALHVKEPLIAPLSKRKCVFYSMTIEQNRRSGKRSYWKTIVNEVQFQEFFVDVKGEYVIVKPQDNPINYISYLVPDKNTSSGLFNDPTPEFESLLKNYRIDSAGFLGFNKQLRYKEGIIAIGETITVAGIAQWKELNESIPEYNYSKIATLESRDKQKLIITDLPQKTKSLG